MEYAHPEYLVSTDWLAAHLDDPQVRILDCSVYLRPTPEGTVRPDSGFEDWQAGHIPGSVYADLLKDLSDRDSPLPVMMPSAEQFGEAMRRYGIDRDSHVVLYDTGEGTWAARLWWMLRAFGCGNAAILNGGFRKWQAEGRMVTDEPPVVRDGDFRASLKPALISDRSRVEQALDESRTVLLNGLSAAEFSGEVCRVARPGRIPGSRNIPASQLIDPADNTFRSADELDSMLRQAGVPESRQVITYCGGGIAASALAFVLALMGTDAVSVYDGSLAEWSADPDLPLETG